MSITISDTTPRVQYTATSSQTTFSVPFEFFNNADLVVVKTASGTDTTLSFNASPSSATQYSVTGAGVSGGGSITLGGGATAGHIYTIYRDLAIARTTDFSASGSFPVETLNTELDKIVAMSQQLERDLKFSPRASATTANTFNITFPDLVADKILSVNSSGNGLEFSQSITDVSTVAGIASDVTTVSGIASNVTTVAGIASNVTAVANDSADIGAVAGKATEIGRLGTADAVADLALLGTSDVVADLALLGTSDVVADMALLANADVIADMNTLATSDIISDLNTLATSDIVTDLNILATSDNVTNMATLGASGVVTNIGTVAGISSNVTTVAGISSNVTTVAGISSNVTAVANDSTDIGNVAGSISNVNTVAGSISNVNTVASANSNISTVAGAIDNVNTVASNVSGVNSFADRYRVDSSDPSSSLDAGDLAFNTSSNVLKYYDGSAWQTITADTDVKTKVSSNDTTAGFLNGKLVAGTNVTFTEGSDGGNETLTIASADNSIPFAIALG